MMVQLLLQEEGGGGGGGGVDPRYVRNCCKGGCLTDMSTLRMLQVLVGKKKRDQSGVLAAGRGRVNFIATATHSSCK